MSDGQATSIISHFRSILSSTIMSGFLCSILLSVCILIRSHSSLFLVHSYTGCGSWFVIFLIPGPSESPAPRCRASNVDFAFKQVPCIPHSETKGQIVGTRESLNGAGNMARRKVKNGEKSPWGQCLTRPVPNGRRRSDF